MTDWVKYRLACTLTAIFEELKTRVERDVRQLNEAAGRQVCGFHVNQEGDDPAFWVSRDGRIVEFFPVANAITAAERGPMGNQEPLLVAVPLITLDDRRFEVDGRSLEAWEVSRLALERTMFFPAG